MRRFRISGERLRFNDTPGASARDTSDMNARVQIRNVRPKLRVTQRHLAAVAAPRLEPGAQSFKRHEPAPGVLPDGVAMAMDEAADQLYSGYAMRNSYGEGIGFLGYPYLAELAQRPEYRRISETIAKEMTRKWLRLTSQGDDDKTDKLTALESAMADNRIREKFCELAEHDGFFGRGQLFIDTGASDAELKMPLLMSPAKIRKGGSLGFQPIEPMWTYPAAYNATDPKRADFYVPPTWFVMGREVHRTRLLTFVSREVPDILKPAYMFGGVSMSQMARPYVENWLRTRQSVSDLIASFTSWVLKTNLAMLLNGGSANDAVMRAQLFTQMQANRGVLMLDKDTEDFANVSTSLAGLDHLQAQAQEQMASVSAIPLVKLLGVTPSGLNASTDGEIRVFYDWVHAQQEDLFRPNLKTVLEVLQLNLFGEIDPDIGFMFEPLWQASDAEAATIVKTQADTDVAYLGAGVVTPEEIRARLAADDESPYANLDLSEPLPDPVDVEGDDPEDDDGTA